MHSIVGTIYFFYFFLFCQKANPFCSVLKEDIRDETDEYVDVHNK